MNQVNDSLAPRLQRLLESYGSGADGGSPSLRQWEAVLGRPADAPLTLINFFQFRPEAHYPAGDAHSPCSGEEAFRRYAAVSAPALAKAGGHFLEMGGFGGTLMGTEESWHFVAVGRYPNRAAFLALYEDPAYQAAFVHRRAACLRQRVEIVSPMPG